MDSRTNAAERRLRGAAQRAAKSGMSLAEWQEALRQAKRAVDAVDIGPRLPWRLAKPEGQ